MASVGLLCMSLSRITVSDSIENIWSAVPAIIDTREDQETVDKIKAALRVLSEELLWEIPDFLMEEDDET